MKTDYDVALFVVEQWQEQEKDSWVKVALELVKQKLSEILKS